MTNHRGRLIAVCGIDGAGKSTIVKRVADELRMNVYIAKKECKDYLDGLLHCLAPHQRPAADEWAAGSFVQSAAGMTVLDFLAHYSKHILPQLDQRDLVLCDRYITCYEAYLKCAGASSLAPGLSKLVLKPHLNILIDVDPLIALERIAKRGGATPDEHPSMLQRLRTEYLSIAASDPHHWFVVSSQENDVEAIVQAVLNRINLVMRQV